MAEPARAEWRAADEALLRRSDDLLVDFDRAFPMFQECVTGCRALYDIGLAVMVFGSARFDEDHRYYRLAQPGYVSVTGGGPGILEAASRGARDPGGLGRDHWQGMLDFISQTMFREGTAEEGEVGTFLVTDSVAEAVDHTEQMVRRTGRPSKGRTP